MIKHPMELIESVQEKPESVRRAIAFAAVAVITAVIVGIWITTFSLPSAGGEASVLDTAVQPSPLTLLWNFVKGLF